MERLELNDMAFREAESTYMKANDDIAEEGSSKNSAFIGKEAIDNLMKAAREYYSAAGILAERLKMKYHGQDAGNYGQIFHFDLYREDNGSLSIICVSVGRKNESELIYNKVRLTDLKKELLTFELPFGN